MTELKLQPCPFCGATGVPKSWRGRTYQKITHAADCYFGGSHCWMDHDDRFESWNRRAEPTCEGCVNIGPQQCHDCRRDKRDNYISNAAGEVRRNAVTSGGLLGLSGSGDK